MCVSGIYGPGCFLPATRLFSTSRVTISEFINKTRGSRQAPAVVERSHVFRFFFDDILEEAKLIEAQGFSPRFFLQIRTSLMARVIERTSHAGGLRMAHDDDRGRQDFGRGQGCK